MSSGFGASFYSMAAAMFLRVLNSSSITFISSVVPYGQSAQRPTALRLLRRTQECRQSADKAYGALFVLPCLNLPA
jgi:hypothetical protein